MLKIGITGQSGFIGTHLYNYLGIQENIERIEFKDEFFQQEKQLFKFVESCDAIVHLAALNRHNDPQEIYNTNIQLVKQLISACEQTGSTPHILFSSSTQEEKDNPYGISKKEGRELLKLWAERNNGQFTGFIIPNVFGPYGHPYYNSVVATFCHQLTHNEIPEIKVDGLIKLIYVGELVKQVFERIIEINTKYINAVISESIQLPHTAEIKVSDLLDILNGYKSSYFEKGEIPELVTTFKRDLFNTFVGYIDHNEFFPFKLEPKADNRGSFTEIIKLNSGGQISFSTTKSGITRGNHFHTRKAERFAVIKGKAKIEIRKTGTDKVLEFNLNGDEPSFVDMPIWYTHNITNIGDEDLYTIFWINEFFDPNDPDTYYEEV